MKKNIYGILVLFFSFGLNPICISTAIASAPYFFKSPVQVEKIRKDAATSNKRLAMGFHQHDGETNWQRIAAGTVANQSHLVHIAWEAQRPPYGVWDWIRLHRLVKGRSIPMQGVSKNKVVFLLPGTFDAGGWSRLRHVDVNPFIFLAQNGYDVYTVSFRNAFIPNMEYEQIVASGIDLSVTAEWTFGVYREDINACVDKIKQVSHTSKIFLGGFSRGALLAFIYASKYQNNLKGLVVLDGPIKKLPPLAEEAVNDAVFAYIIDRFQQGQLPVSDTCDSVLCPPPGIYPLLGEATWDNYANWQLASVVPMAISKTGGDLPPPFTTLSAFVADDAHYLWGEGILTNYYGGAIDHDVLVTGLAEFTRYWPIVQNFEWWQLDAYDDVPYFDYDDNPIDLPAVAFLSRFFCPDAVCLDDSIPNKTIHSDVTIHYLEQYGHLDIMFGANTLEDVKLPLLEWLDEHR